jgi:uncharacterized Zn finger protein
VIPRDPTRVIRRDGPRRLKAGIRLRRKEGHENLRWPALPWFMAIAGGPGADLAEGLDYARAGQVGTLNIGPARIEASVQGRAPRPYVTTVGTLPLSVGEWDRVVTTMAGEALWSAKLLTGELPTAIESVFLGVGRSLLPAASEVVATCTCTDRAARPDVACKHLVAVACLLAERIELDPLLCFTLRGLDGQRLLERLQEARTIATRGASTAHSTPSVIEAVPAPPPSESCLRDFWRPGPRLDELAGLAAEERIPHALLRRLGPTPFQAGLRPTADVGPRHGRTVPTVATEAPPPVSRFPLVGLLASIYDAVANAAGELRDAAPDDTRPDQPGDGNDEPNASPNSSK